MKETSRDKILRTGAEIIHLKGFHHTGIQEILDTAGVPKGSFYNYFKSKEDFGLQVIDYFVNFFYRLTKKVVDDDTIAPLEKIDRILGWFLEFFEIKDYAYGCPIGNLSQEMGDLSPAFREKLRDAFNALADVYARLIADAQRAGDISGSIDVRDTANFIVSSWHGALVHMKIVKGPEPLENHRKFIFECILKTGDVS
jgi:TetR/AcrR family transcriptional regulator, transcriptional repressor for nem operon